MSKKAVKIKTKTKMEIKTKIKAVKDGGADQDPLAVLYMYACKAGKTEPEQAGELLRASQIVLSGVV